MAQSKPTPAARRAMDARQGVARQDMAMGLCGLVKPAIRLKPGQLRGFVENLPQPWNGGELRISGPQIDAGDLGVLLACAALALKQTAEGDATDGIGAGRDAPGLMVPPAKRAKGDAKAENKGEDLDVFTLETTLAALCKEIGRDPDDGRAHEAIRDSLGRLASIVISARGEDGKRAFTHLVADGADDGKNAVSVTLNYRLTRAMLGTGSYGRVRMNVWRSLSPVAQCLYHFLACWRPGHGQCPEIGLDKLAPHVWGDEAAGATLRDRRRMLLAALAELPSDEWTVQIHGKSARIDRKNIDAQAGPEPVFLPTPSAEPVFLPTPTRVLAHASPSEKQAHIRLSHEMGESLTPRSLGGRRL